MSARLPDITVYGSSDDLIEVEGCISEEFNAIESYDGTGELLAFSNGVVLQVRFDDQGVWRIVPLAGFDLVQIQVGTDPDDDYSDRAHISQPASWVVHGCAWAKASVLMRSHATRVKARLRVEEPTYQVVCVTCGNVGPRIDNEEAAEALAARHTRFHIDPENDEERDANQVH